MARAGIQAGSLVGKKLGKYELLALLAIGGTAEIYLARIGGEAGFEKYVVVKCLLDHLADDQDYVKMFLDEARLCAQLEHSNIVQTLELGEYGKRYYLAMEYLAGMSLAQLARKSSDRVRGGLMPIDLVLGLAAQAASGLHYAHERSDTSGNKLNVVHRDVSPQNLVVTFDGILKLVDFGIAKAEDRQTHTRTGTIKGKFAYMSPEQCQAQEVDRRTDIFALGVIMHELFTGRRLFKRSTSYETYQAIVSGKYPAPSKVNHRLDPAIDELVMRAVAHDRGDRYETAEQFGEAMLALLHRRGKSIGSADIARYFDEHFGLELEQHSNRMRQLIEGRAQVAEELKWDAPEDDPPETKARRKSATAPPKPAESPDGATRVEINPLERIQELHSKGEGPRLPDTKERTRPVNLARGKSATPRVDALMRGTNAPLNTPAPAPIGKAGGNTGDTTAPGMKKRPRPLAADRPTAALGKPGPMKIPAIAPIGAGGGDPTRELQRKPPGDAAAETRDERPPRSQTAETREVLREEITGDEPTVLVGDDDDAATILRTDGYPVDVHGVKGEPLGLAETREAPRLTPPAGALDGSSSEKTRPALSPARTPVAAAPVAPPPQFARQSVPPGAVSNRELGRPPMPMGQAPGASGPMPGPPGYGPPGAGPPAMPGQTGPMPPNVQGSSGQMPNMQGSSGQMPNMQGSSGQMPNMQGSSGQMPVQMQGPTGHLPRPSSSGGFPAAPGDYAVPMLHAPTSKLKLDRGTMVLVLVFVLSVGVGLTTTFLLFR